MLRRPRFSIGLRLLFFFGVIGITLNILVFSIFISDSLRLEWLFPSEIHSQYGDVAHVAPNSPLPYAIIMRLRFAQKLLNRLAATDDAEKIKDAADEAGVEIARTQNGQMLGTFNLEEAFRSASPYYAYPDFRVSASLIARDEGPVKWAVKFPPGWKQHLFADPRYILIVITNLVISIFLIWIFRRWQLKPLQELKIGADEIAKSNFKFQIKNIQRSELGDLATAFNVMGSKVRSLIESKERLLMSVSHDLRSPISRIKLALEVEGAQAIPRIRKNLKQMETLVNQLLELGRIETTQDLARAKPVNVGIVFSGLKSEFAKEPVHFHLEAEVATASIRGDSELIRSVFVNTIENGLKYAKTAETRVDVTGRLRGTLIEFVIHDNGRGVASENLEKIFEPFFRIDDSRKDGNYGLGLSLCRQITKSYGAEITARLPVEGGFDIVVTWPIA